MPGVITALYQDQEGAVWVGTQDDGLKRWNPAARQFLSYRNRAGDLHSLADNRVSTLMQDRSGSLWVGTWNRGISRVDLLGGGFARFVHLADDPNSIGAGRIQGIAADSEGVIWIGTSEDGLNRLDKKTGQIRRYLHNPSDPYSISHNTVRAVKISAQGIWVGTAGGLDLLDPLTGRFTHFNHNPQDPNSLSSNQIYALNFDRSGFLWICTMSNGLDRFDPVKKEFQRYPFNPKDPNSLSSPIVTQVLEDSRGDFWVSTAGGLDRLDRKTGRFEHFRHDEKDATSLSNNIATRIYEDSAKNVWVATTSGLNLVERDANGKIRFKRYTVKDGMENDVVLVIEEDRNGRLWLGTNTGISRFDYKQNSFKNFSATDGLIDGTYMVGGGYKDQQGLLYFGGTRGLNIFDPQAIRDNTALPQVAITDFMIFNRSVRGGGSSRDFKIDNAITMAKSITMSYQYSVFSLEFAALHFADPLRNRYAYKLEGFDKDWVTTDATHRIATYTNLDPGHYVFKVKAATKEGKWSENAATLSITITPPFWKTWWFCLLALMLLSGLIYWAYRARIRHFSRQQIWLEGEVRERTNEALMASVAAEERSRQVSTLLDNSGQGFLSFSDDLMVDAEYSRECKHIFRRNIANAFLPTLLFGDDGEQASYIQKNLDRVFACGEDSNRREIYMGLLPVEYHWHGCDYEAQYRYLSDHRIMLILTDVSDEKALQEKIQQERQRVDFLVNAMENRNDLLDSLEAWRQFQNEIESLLSGEPLQKRANLIKIHREIHTFKGLFAQEGLPSMPPALHKLEDQLADLLKIDTVSMETLRLALHFNDLKKPLESDLTLLREKLGSAYFAAGKLVHLPETVIDHLEATALRCVDPELSEGKNLLAALQRLHYQALSLLLTPHFKAVGQLAERLGKELHPVHYEGEEVQVDPRILTPFCKSLVHVFRNCVDHGLEDPEARLNAGKDEAGNIHCRVSVHGQRLLLCIGDDGNGIAIERLRSKAVEIGLISVAEADMMSEQMILRLIFVDGLSTRDQITEISGRGIGLAATLHELGKLGGTVEVVSQPGAGTQFRFDIPITPEEPMAVVPLIDDQRILHDQES